MPRQLDAELVGAVRQFRRRRRWRHILSMTAGAILLVLGTALVAAHFVHHGSATTPALSEGVGLYAAGVLLFTWGAAGGFTRKLAKWLPASAVLGLVAVAVFALAALFSNEADTVFYNGRAQGGTTSMPQPPRQASPAARASSRVLAAELLDESDVEQLLGSAPAALETPGASLVRNRSLAIWRASAIGELPRAARSAHGAAVSLTVQESARQARKIRSRGSRGNVTPLATVGDGGYVRTHNGSTGAVTRVRASRGNWVVALQLRADAAADRTGQLADQVSHLLGLLSAASTE